MMRSFVEIDQQVYRTDDLWLWLRAHFFSI